MTESKPELAEDGPGPMPTKTKRGVRFWAVFPGLCISTILCALEATVVAVALPTIARELEASSQTVWVINAYTLTYTAVQPLYGQIADLFGRKASLISALLLFLFGGGICGGANSIQMLIAGRAIQGLGGGGLSVLPSMVVSDLVPLRERPLFSGIIYAGFAIGTCLGPVVGGLMVDNIGWRWIFWFNLPVGGLAVGLVAMFLKMKRPRNGPVWRQLLRIDFIGILWLIASMTSILWPLSTVDLSASTQWSSWRILLPLCLGIAGLPLFLCYEAALCPEPLLPIRLFKNLTSTLGYLMSFVHGCLLFWAIYFLPIYFQSVLGASPKISGVNTLPFLMVFVPMGIINGALVTRINRYKPSQVIGFAIITVGVGCLSILGRNSSTAVWAVIQIVFAIGMGLVLSSTLAAVLAPLPESDVALATGAWGFIQGLGFVLGIGLPSSIFESKFRDLISIIQDTSVKEELVSGGAYEHASNAFLNSLHGDSREQVINAFEKSLSFTWKTGLAFSLVGFVAGVLIKEIKLRETLDTDYGLQDAAKDGSADPLA